MPAKNVAARAGQRERALIAQFQPAPPALARELNDPDGNGSVTVTVEPSVGAFPAFKTDSVNVVGRPATRLPEWLW